MPIILTVSSALVFFFYFAFIQVARFNAFDFIDFDMANKAEILEAAKIETNWQVLNKEISLWAQWHLNDPKTGEIAWIANTGLIFPSYNGETPGKTSDWIRLMPDLKPGKYELNLIIYDRILYYEGIPQHPPLNRYISVAEIEIILLNGLLFSYISTQEF